MNTFSEELITQPQWFLPTFVVFWLVITGFLAYAGGWVSLSNSFAADRPASGERFRFVSGAMGVRFMPVSYGNCLFVTVESQGIHLSILFPFRFLSPPLYLPWTAFEEVSERRMFFVRVVRMRAKGHWPWITLRGRVGRAALRAYEGFRSDGMGAA